MERKLPTRFVEIEAKGKSMKFRLTRECEKELYKEMKVKNMAEVFKKSEDDIMGTFVSILHASAKPFLEKDEKFAIEDAEQFLDDFIDEGKTLIDIQELSQEILLQCGYFPTKEQTKKIQREEIRQKLEYEQMVEEERELLKRDRKN